MILKVLHKEAFKDLKTQLIELGFSVGQYAGVPTPEYSKPPLHLQPEKGLGGAYAEFDRVFLPLAAKTSAQEVQRAYARWLQTMDPEHPVWPVEFPRRNFRFWKVHGFTTLPLRGAADLVFSEPHWNAYGAYDFDSGLAFAAAEFAYFAAHFLWRGRTKFKVSERDAYVEVDGEILGVMGGAAIMPDGSFRPSSFVTRTFLNGLRMPPPDRTPALTLWQEVHAFLLEQAEHATDKRAGDVAWSLEMAGLLRWTVGDAQDWNGSVRRKAVPPEERKRRRALKAQAAAASAAQDKATRLRAVQAAQSQLELLPWVPTWDLYMILRTVGGFSYAEAASVLGRIRRTETRREIPNRLTTLQGNLRELEQQLQEELKHERLHRSARD